MLAVQLFVLSLAAFCSTSEQTWVRYTLTLHKHAAIVSLLKVAIRDPVLVDHRSILVISMSFFIGDFHYLGGVCGVSQFPRYDILVRDRAGHL